MSGLLVQPRYVLSLGDGMPATGDQYDLRAIGGGDTACFFLDGTFAWANGQGKGTLLIQGTDTRWAWRRYDELQRALDLGTKAAQPNGSGVRATIGLLLEPDQMVFLDVTGGGLASSPDLLDARTLSVPMTFTTLPYARGAPQHDDITATLTNDVSTVVYRPLIPGTAPALVRLELVDSSTGGLVINRGRVSVWSDRYLTSGSYPAFTSPTAAAPGTIVSSMAQITASNDWQDICQYGYSLRGQFAFLVRASDSSTATAATMKKPTALNTYTAGALPVGGYTYVVVALNAGGKVLAISPTTTIHAPSETSATHETQLTWPTVTGAANHRVYWKRDFQSWLYLTTGSATGTYLHITESGATTANPPTQADASLISAQLRAQLCSGDGTVLRTLDPVSFQYSNGQAEHLELYRGPLPGHGRGESGLGDASIVRVQGKSAGTNTPTLRVGAAALLNRAAGSYSEWWVRADNLATTRTHILDPNRTGTQRAYLVSIATGAYIGPLDCWPAALEVDPGQAAFAIVLDGAGGVADNANLKVAVRVVVIPRYSSIAGLPWY